MNTVTSADGTLIAYDRTGSGEPLVSSSGLTKHKALVDWLKADHGLGHGHATALVGYALAQRDADGRS